MSDNDSKSMLERLASLEVWADARKKEFQKLKELKESVYTLQKDNFDMKKDLFVLRAENEKLAEVNENLTEKLESLETTVATLVNDIPDMQANKQEMEMLGRKVTKLESLETTVATLLNDIPDMQANKQEMEMLGRKVDAHETRTKAIEGKMIDVHQSVTYVYVNTRDDKLFTDQYVPLDRRDDGWGVDIDGLWDGGRHRVVVRRDGRYGVGGTWRQLGAGVVYVRVEWAGRCRGGRGLGQTSGAGDVACGMTVVALKEGDEVWLEALRWKGGARIWGCEMFCWLL